MSSLLIQDDDSRYIEVRRRGRFLAPHVRSSMIVVPKNEGEIRKGFELYPADGADSLDNDPFKITLVVSLITVADANRCHNT